MLLSFSPVESIIIIFLLMAHREISIPNILEWQPQAYYAQLRPFREGGNLLKKVKTHQKTIIHNYGHGGAGISLAPGSAIQALQLSQGEPSSRGIAVLGCGVIGLFTAKFYLETHPGAPLTIYAEKIPLYNTKTNSQMITSQVAPGYWLPYSYGSDNPALHKLLTETSLAQYEKLRDTPRYQSIVKSVEVINLTDQTTNKFTYSVLPQKIRQTWKKISVRISNNNRVVQGHSFTTLRINMPIFIETLLQEVKSLGAHIVQRTITQKDLPSMKEDLVFNCCGLSSRELFGDSKMKGIKGHVVEYGNPNPSKFNYFLKMNLGPQTVMLYMHDNRMVLGLTRSQTENIEIETDQIQLVKDNFRELMVRLGVEQRRPKL